MLRSGPLVPEMDAGRRLLTAFSRHPGAFHTGLLTPEGCHVCRRFRRSELPFAPLVERRPVSAALSLMSRFRACGGSCGEHQSVPQFVPPCVPRVSVNGT